MFGILTWCLNFLFAITQIDKVYILVWMYAEEAQIAIQVFHSQSLTYYMSPAPVPLSLSTRILMVWSVTKSNVEAVSNGHSWAITSCVLPFSCYTMLFQVFEPCTENETQMKNTFLSFILQHCQHGHSGQKRRREKWENRCSKKIKMIFLYNAILCWALAFTWMLDWHVPPTLPKTNYAHLSHTETWWRWFLLQDDMPHNSAKAAQEWPEEHEAQRDRAKIPDLIRLKIHEMHTKSTPWRPHLATHRTQRMSATSCQTPQEIPRGTMSDWAMAERGRGGGHITLERCLL